MTMLPKKLRIQTASPCLFKAEGKITKDNTSKCKVEPCALSESQRIVHRPKIRISEQPTSGSKLQQITAPKEIHFPGF